IADGDFNVLDVDTEPGSVMIEEDVESVNLRANNITIETGGNGCISVTVRDFNDISEFQFSMAWDPAVATFTNVAQLNTNLPGFSFANNFSGNTANGRLAVDYTAASPITLANNAKLFDVCFTGGANSDVTNFTFTNNPTPINFVT